MVVSPSRETLYDEDEYYVADTQGNPTLGEYAQGECLNTMLPAILGRCTGRQHIFPDRAKYVVYPHKFERILPIINYMSIVCISNAALSCVP
jgi:hypothetical protein